MATKTKVDIDEVFSVFPVQVKLPPAANAREGADGEAETTVLTVMRCATYGIARYMAYAIAMQGIPTRFVKRENKQNHPRGWYSVSVEKATGMGNELANDIRVEAVADRGILAARDMRSRARLGPMIGEIRGVMAETDNDYLRTLLKVATNALGQAMAERVMPENPINYGATWVENSEDVLATVAEAWGVDPIQTDGICAQCGRVHEQPDEVDMDTLMDALHEAMADEVIADPVVPQA